MVYNMVTSLMIKERSEVRILPVPNKKKTKYKDKQYNLDTMCLNEGVPPTIKKLSAWENTIPITLGPFNHINTETTYLYTRLFKLW
jgi:hypothetical protein